MSTPTSTSSCYLMEKHKYANNEPGLFDSCCLQAYVLCLDQPKKIRRVRKELDKHKPHSRTYIQLNKGFKKCSKPHLPVQKTQYDLFDSLCYAFTHALKALDNHEGHILVFEDDFYFGSEHTQNDVESVSQFILSSKPDVYNLGPFAPVRMFPFGLSFGKDHLIHRYYMGTHAMIYSSGYMNYVLNNRKTLENKYNGHVDRIWDGFNLYAYKNPIVFQPFPCTANMRNWSESGSGFEVTCQMFKFFDLDRSNKYWSIGGTFVSLINLPRSHILTYGMLFIILFTVTSSVVILATLKS